MKVIRPIQYLRGVAALMVVAHHAANQIAAAQAYLKFDFGPSGVDLFFVISGFIMVVTTRNIGPWEFMRRRIVRVVPLYWLLTLCMVALALAAPNLFKTLRFSAETVVESLLFVPHYSLSFPGVAWPVLVPGWTLNYEMFFYAAFALSLLLPIKGRLAAIVAVFGLLVIIGYVFGPFQSAASQTYTSPLLLEFVCGAVIGRLWSAGRLSMPWWVSMLALAGGATLLVLRDAQPLGPFNQMLGAAFVVAGALHPRFANWRNGPLQALGDASYSIYLTHLFTLGLLRVVWTKLAPVTFTATSAWGFLLLALIACAAVGWASYRLLEQPLLRWLNQRTQIAARTA